MFFKLERALFFLTLLFLPTQLGRHFWPEFAYVYSLRIDYYSPTIYFWDILALLTSFIYVIRGGSINKKLLLIILLFFLSQITSLAGNSNPGPGMVRMFQYFTAASFGLYIGSLKKLKFQSLVFPIKIALIFEAGLSIMQFINEGSIGLWFLGEREFTISTSSIANFNWFGNLFLRPYGTFPHPNVLAAFIVLFFPILNHFRKSTLVSLFSGTIVFLTFSRAAILVFIVEVFLLFRSNLKMVTFITVLLLPFLLVRFESIYNFDRLSITRREELARFSLGEFTSNPFFGIGLNNFIYSFASSGVISGPSRFLQPVHNIILLVLSETGLIGIIGFIILIFVPISVLWSKKDKKFPRILLICWCVTAILGSIDHFFLTLPQGQRMLFFLIGLSMLEYPYGYHKTGV